MKTVFCFIIAFAACATVTLYGQVPFGNNPLNQTQPVIQVRNIDDPNTNQKLPRPPAKVRRKTPRAVNPKNQNQNSIYGNQPTAPYSPFPPNLNQYPSANSQERGQWNAKAPMLPMQSKVDSKLKEYKNAKETARKNEIEKEIKDLLSQQFDDRMKGPAVRIEQSRKHLDELTKQIKNRDSKSDEIINLRLQVLTNQVMGLGWGSTSNRGMIDYSAPTATRAFFPAQSDATIFSTMPEMRKQFAPNYSRRGNFPRPTARSTVEKPILQVNPPKKAASPNQARKQTATESVGEPEVQPGLPKLAPTQNQLPKDVEPEQVSNNQLLLELKNAKDNSERQRIKKALKERLREEFDQHQQHLKRSADKIEEQISAIDANVKERKKMKKEIVELKLKTLINQAKGLGF